jgi:hypothetical protein
MSLDKVITSLQQNNDLSIQSIVCNINNTSSIELLTNASANLLHNGYIKESTELLNAIKKDRADYIVDNIQSVFNQHVINFAEKGCKDIVKIFNCVANKGDYSIFDRYEQNLKNYFNTSTVYKMIANSARELYVALRKPHCFDIAYLYLEKLVNLDTSNQTYEHQLQELQEVAIKAYDIYHDGDYLS